MFGINPWRPRHDHSFEIAPVEPVPPLFWGARAIYKSNGYIDIVHDRMACNFHPDIETMIGMKDTTDDAARNERLSFLQKALLSWVDDRGMPAMRRLLLESPLEIHSSAEVKVASYGFELVANPRRSFGYLYLGAWPTTLDIHIALPWKPPALTASRANVLRSLRHGRFFRYAYTRSGKTQKLVDTRLGTPMSSHLRAALNWLREEGLALRIPKDSGELWEVHGEHGERALRQMIRTRKPADAQSEDL